MAHHKQGGKTRQNVRRDGKSFGLKVSNGQKVSEGNVLITQVGTVYHAGTGVSVGRNFTLFAEKDGKVKFGKRMSKTTVSVV